MKKAIGLFSGGLDSTIAAKLIQREGIDVEVLIFSSPFFNVGGEKCFAVKAAKENKIPFKLIDLGLEYLEILRKPKHGFGKNLNPCIDCKILMLKKAKKYMEKVKAEFVFTGEVMGQRPKSQYKPALLTIEKESGLKGKLLRPLSAKLLEETDAEKKGLVDRSRLSGITGRQRKSQFKLRKTFDIKVFATPAGGCLLTQKDYCSKLKDLLDNKEDISLNDLYLLKVGRHFRFNSGKIIVGRNKEDNDKLLELKSKDDLFFEAKDIKGPITLLQGIKTKKSIELAASLTARYSDAEKDKVVVLYDDKEIVVNKIKELEKLRI